jgi:hypothetical protein
MTNFDVTQFQSNLYNPLEQDSYSYRITMPSQYEKKLYEQGTLQISEEQQQQIERLINSWTLEQLLTKEALAGEQPLLNTPGNEIWNYFSYILIGKTN